MMRLFSMFSMDNTHNGEQLNCVFVSHNTTQHLILALPFGELKLIFRLATTSINLVFHSSLKLLLLV